MLREGEIQAKLIEGGSGGTIEFMSVSLRINGWVHGCRRMDGPDR